VGGAKREPVALHERDADEIQRPGRVVRPFVGGDAGAQLLSAGVVTFPARSDSIPHTHGREEEVLYVLAGRGALVCDGRPLPLEPGSFVFVPPGVEHFVRVESDEPLRLFYAFSPPVVIGSW
jgi:mannose-6-phosphate isomerase-like protein (cupin superfamily)